MYLNKMDRFCIFDEGISISVKGTHGDTWVFNGDDDGDEDGDDDG